MVLEGSIGGWYRENFGRVVSRPSKDRTGKKKQLWPKGPFVVFGKLFYFFKVVQGNSNSTSHSNWSCFKFVGVTQRLKEL